MFEKNVFLLTPYFLDRPVPELKSLASPDWGVNCPSLPAGEVRQRMLALYEPLQTFVAQTAVSGRRPVSIAGDCCTTIAVLAGLQRAELNPTLIWFDAHGDFNTWETTPSGFFGGMPLAMLVGRGEQTFVEGVDLYPFPETQVILTDARDLDSGERTLVAESAVTHLPQPEAMLAYDLPDGPLYVHFDTDIVNPEEAPAMNYRAPGGPSVATLRRVFRTLAQTGRIAAVSMSAWNPQLDEDGRSREACMGLLYDLLC